MPDRGNSDTDLFRVWLDSQKALLAGANAAPWQSAQQLFKAWSGFSEAFSAAHHERHGGPDTSPFDPAGWLRPEGAGGMADMMRWMEGPEFADTGAETRRMVRGMAEWIAYLSAAEQMKAVLALGWIGAFQDFVGALTKIYNARQAAGEPEPRWEDIQALWRDHAVRKMTATYRAPGYLAAQRDLLTAEIALRRRLRGQVEQLAEFLGLPTRAEMDDMHRGLHKLRRDLRAARAGKAAP